MTGSRFIGSVCACGSVRRGGAVEGKFVAKPGVEVLYASGGCTCGGRPRVRFEIDGGVVRFSTVAKEINGKRVVMRPVTVGGNGWKQVLYIKYEVV